GTGSGRDQDVANRVPPAATSASASTSASVSALPPHQLAKKDGELTGTEQVTVLQEMADLLAAGQLSAARIVLHRIRERADRSQGLPHQGEAVALRNEAERWMAGLTGQPGTGR